MVVFSFVGLSVCLLAITPKVTKQISLKFFFGGRTWPKQEVFTLSERFRKTYSEYKNP